MLNYKRVKAKAKETELMNPRDLKLQSIKTN